MSTPSNIFLPNVLVIGDSGSGKSTSYRKLPPDKTCIIDTEQKGFPFREKFTNVKYPTNPKEFMDTMDAVKKEPTIKYVVLDSFIETLRMFMKHARETEKGYDIFNKFSSSIAVLMRKCRSNSQIIIVMAHPEAINVMSPSGAQTTKRVASVLQGKEWEGKVESQFLVTLFTDVKADETDLEKKYGFLTNSDGVTSAKSPIDMFKEKRIPNDLNKVTKAIVDYYPELKELGF